MARFVHLHVHTEYSLVDSVVRVRPRTELLREGWSRLRAAGMPAVAITDQGNLFALVKFYRAALARGVKPIVGADALVPEQGERAEPSRAGAAVPERSGYRNLTRLLTRA